MKEFILVQFLILLMETSSTEQPNDKLAEAIQKEVFRNITQSRFMFKKGNVTGRTRTRDGFPVKRPLPGDDQVFKEEFYPLECGATYSIAQEGYVYFDLAPGSEQCYYALLGSKNQGCTVGVYCNGNITLAPPTTQGCDQEYLVLTDGTVGMMSGCGACSFNKIPRYPRNGGSDMYVLVKGNDKSVICIALCLEDLEPGMYGLSPPKRIAKNRDYAGLWTERQCRCGVRGNTARIVSGEDATKEEFPWMAAITFTGYRFAFCGGSLISDRHILSAAHCFNHKYTTKDTVQVLLHAHVLDHSPLKEDVSPNDPQLNNIPGWNLPNETDKSENTIRLQVADIRIHPMFDSNTFDYDFAILTLAHPISLLDPGISTICMPFSEENRRYQDDEPMTVSGWGAPWEGAPASSRILQKLEMPFVNRRTCKQFTSVTDRHICAGYLEGGKDSCSGDSGGPLVTLMDSNTNQYLLAGIVSAGAGCARPGDLGLYSDVREAAQWIYFHTPGAVWCSR